MILTAHQAVYGDHNGAHVLIAKSSQAKSPFAELTRRTDRPPGHLPPNLRWQPYVSGYPYEHWYVLTKTFPDETASRAGMVITHALVFNLEELISVNDLSPVLQLLPTAPNKDANVTAVEIGVADSGPTQNAPGFANVIRLLLNDATPDKPVVWVGQDGFEPIIAALWNGLWPGARKTFKFRLSFTPQDLEGQEFTIVSTPSEMENRWSGFPVVRLTNIEEPQSKAEAFLMGKPEGEPLKMLLRDLQAEPSTIGDLKMLQASTDYLEQLEKGVISVNAARSLTRLLGTLARSVDQGVSKKAAALQVLMDLTASGSAADIQALNNLDLRPFRTGAKALKEAIASWFARHAIVDDTESARATADMLAMSFANPPSAWTAAIHDSLRDTLYKWPQRAAAAIWRWWQVSPSLVISLEDYVPTSDHAERDLATECPHKLAEQIAVSTRAFAKARGWLLLHAAIVASYLSPTDAFHEQLQIDTDADYFDGLRLLSSNEPAATLITTALETTDPRLLQIAGEASRGHPELLADLEPQNEAWRRIWFFSIEAGNPPWYGIDNPRSTMDVVIDLLVDGIQIDHRLLRHLSKTVFADLSNYPRRAEAWKKLEKSSVDDFLRATADGWLKKLSANPSLEEAVDPILEDAILSPAQIGSYLSDVHSLEMLGNVFRRFPRLTGVQFEHHLLVALNNRSVDSFDAILVGKIIMDRHWRGIATALTRMLLVGNRQDLIPAVQECKSLLGWLDQFQLWSSGKLTGIQISYDDWWRALQETVTELYSHGPEHVWERAGGDASVINRNQSGQNQWREALILLRHGGGGKSITPKSLLNVMCSEYANNQKLRVLREWLNRS